MVRPGQGQVGYGVWLFRAPTLLVCSSVVFGAIVLLASIPQTASVVQDHLGGGGDVEIWKAGSFYTYGVEPPWSLCKAGTPPSLLLIDERLGGVALSLRATSSAISICISCPHSQNASILRKALPESFEFFKASPETSRGRCSSFQGPCHRKLQKRVLLSSWRMARRLEFQKARSCIGGPTAQGSIGP